MLTINDSTKGSDSIYNVSIGNIIFAYDQRTFNSDPGLDSLAAYLINNTEAIIEVGAYADSRGRAYYNYLLSIKRASAIKKYLISKGVKQNQVNTVGYGEENPLTYNIIDGRYNSDSQKYNRRAEFRVLNQGKQQLEILEIKDIPESYRNPYYDRYYKKNEKNDIEIEI